MQTDFFFDNRGEIQAEIGESFPMEEAYDETDWLKEYQYMVSCMSEEKQQEDDDKVEQEAFCIRVDRYGDDCKELANCGEYCGRCMKIECGMYNEDDEYE